jgi:hypothetical protein
MSKALASALLLAIMFPISATADSLARFDGGIGAIPAARGGPAPPYPASNNMALGFIPPSLYPWVIKDLRADVKTDGRITVVGRGLLNGGGPNIGTSRGANAPLPLSVFASLFCKLGGTYGPGSDFNSPSAVLDDEGDFKIDGFLTPVPPTPCDSPVLLIRNAESAPPLYQWHAAGIPKR